MIRKQNDMISIISDSIREQRLQVQELQLEYQQLELDIRLLLSMIIDSRQHRRQDLGWHNRIKKIRSNVNECKIHGKVAYLTSFLGFSVKTFVFLLFCDIIIPVTAMIY